jgi:two-component system chemotaxis response regulator CheB
MDTPDIVVIAGSTGALGPLRKIVAALPVDLPATVFVVANIGAQSSVLPEMFQEDCALPVRHAEDQAAFDKSVIYIAPPDRHLLVHNDKTYLSCGAKENFSRPAADPLFRSAAVNYGARVIAVVLSGELDDGAAGLYAVRACGGIAVVQEPCDCQAASMPLRALNSVPDAFVTPAAEIGKLIVSSLSNPAFRDAGISGVTRRTTEIETMIAFRGNSDPTEMSAIGSASDLTCPECGGVLSKMRHLRPLRYRCHTGHAFSEITLEAAQHRQSEEALWSVLRGIQERISLAKERMTTASTWEKGALAADISRLLKYELIVKELLKR